METLCLFCFPDAGGAAARFRPLERGLGAGIEMRPVELAGRGRRMREPAYASVSAAVEDLLPVLQKDCDHGPYALLGHGMGALIAFELAHEIRHRRHTGPRHLFVSGRAAPHIPVPEVEYLHELPDNELKAVFRERDLLPPEFFQHEELLEVFLPLLRADMHVVETYRFRQTDSPLECDVTALFGNGGAITAEDMEAWIIHTRGGFRMHGFPGGNAFFHERMAEVAAVIRQTLEDRPPG